MDEDLLIHWQKSWSIFAWHCTSCIYECKYYGDAMICKKRIANYMHEGGQIA
jgi:hypothetical protein